jgi:hypothetical protein
MEARLLSRGQSSGRSDDKPEVIKKRFQVRTACASCGTRVALVWHTCERDGLPGVHAPPRARRHCSVQLSHKPRSTPQTYVKETMPVVDYFRKEGKVRTGVGRHMRAARCYSRIRCPGMCRQRTHPLRDVPSHDLTSPFCAQVFHIVADRSVDEVYTATKAVVGPLVQREVVEHTAALLGAVHEGNWPAYAALCAPDMTAYERECGGWGPAHLCLLHLAHP